MSQAIVEIGFLVGFLTTWLGFAFLLFPMVLRFVLGGTWLNSLSEPYSERMRRASLFMNEEISRAGRSRIGRIGQLLAAIGISVLIMTGIVWITLRILEKQGIPA
ncbi:hypothetical protein C8J27_102243 [Rhodobacter aestuarii]|uniref:Uncharacterized protein n=1 Tax=Rhodobacter aestuarii TaxID=453582 RepID=A0A1N7NG48_9RHOB|nr:MULTISPECIES: hypothetical protein [Rhodobacter]PTV96449.1 hypothetical protein C8J27_102243 [Rhodobacter aestuarii]SIS97334.1 hypothetical protein SAMN05421580_107243 [Rhodobacter aestuarii]SOC04257.1 hypothetical protein SAMN05877809_103165 [Rhodobacter sp. JA431]